MLLENQKEKRKGVVELIRTCLKTHQSSSRRSKSQGSHSDKIEKEVSLGLANSKVKVTSMQELREDNIEPSKEPKNIPDGKGKGNSLPRNILNVFKKRTDKYTL